jgi:hypothetical protein
MGLTQSAAAVSGEMWQPVVGSILGAGVATGRPQVDDYYDAGDAGSRGVSTIKVERSAGVFPWRDEPRQMTIGARIPLLLYLSEQEPHGCGSFGKASR